MPIILVLSRHPRSSSSSSSLVNSSSSSSSSIVVREIARSRLSIINSLRERPISNYYVRTIYHHQRLCIPPNLALARYQSVNTNQTWFCCDDHEDNRSSITAFSQLSSKIVVPPPLLLIIHSSSAIIIYGDGAGSTVGVPHYMFTVGPGFESHSPRWEKRDYWDR